MGVEVIPTVVNGASSLHTPLENGLAISKCPGSSIVELAKTIANQAEILDQYLKESRSPAPGFEIDSPLNFPDLPPEISSARAEIGRASRELNDLVTGPTESVRWMAWDHNNSLSLHAIYKYQIGTPNLSVILSSYTDNHKSAKSFPINETATFAEISSKVGLDEPNVTRFMRHAMANRIFKEVQPGIVAHTASSRVLAEDEMMNDWVGFCLEELFPASAVTLKAIERNPSTSEPNQTGFTAANNTTDIESMFETLGKSPQRAKRMGRAMVSLTGGEGYELSHLLDGYPWSTVSSGTLVDIGGSHGFVSTALAERYPDMRFIVQDLPKTINSAPTLCGDLAERVKFEAHDFHALQPVKGADVYFFRWIFHNHSDKYAVNMLQRLIPALKKGARVIINDHCLKEPGLEGFLDEKIMRTMDLVMLSLLNAKERNELEFRELFRKASEGFRFLGVMRPLGCRMSIVEAIWEGEDCGAVKVEREH